MILNICEVIFKLILAGMAGMVCGLFSYLLDYCFWKGNIFEGYLPWLAKVMVRRFKPDRYELVHGHEDLLIQEAESIGLYKLLGGCSVCLNVWIAMISWTVICALSFFEWYYCFPYIVYSSWMIRKQVKATY